MLDDKQLAYIFYSSSQSAAMICLYRICIFRLRFARDLRNGRFAPQYRRGWRNWMNFLWKRVIWYFVGCLCWCAWSCWPWLGWGRVTRWRGSRSGCCCSSLSSFRGCTLSLLCSILLEGCCGLRKRLRLNAIFHRGFFTYHCLFWRGCLLLFLQVFICFILVLCVCITNWGLPIILQVI